MRELGVGVRCLLEGQRWVASRGRRIGLGLLPGLVTLVLYAGALIGLGFGADNLVSWLTGFADGWPSPWLGLFRGGLTVLVFALGLFLAVVTFTAVALLVGQPFYEALSEELEREKGGEAPASGLPLWREIWVSVTDSLYVLVRVVAWGVVLFALGFVPFVGQTVVPAAGFCVSGFFLTQELTSVALQRRGIRAPEGLALLKGHRAAALGFGVPLTLGFLVPLVAVFLMPGAVAGATLLVRDLLVPPVGAEPPGPRSAAEDARDAGTAPLLAPPGDPGPG